MQFYALRRRTLGRLLVATLIALLAMSVAAHHSGLASVGHDGNHGAGEKGASMTMCVGMAVAGIAVEGLVVIRRSRRNSSRGRRRPEPRLRPQVIRLALAAGARPRDGPPLYLQLCVIRR